MKPSKIHVVRLTAEDIARIVEILTAYRNSMPRVFPAESEKVTALIKRILSQASK